MGDRLYRSPTDRVIAGVAGGIAVWIRIDPSLVRIAWVLAAILSLGIFALIYIVMMIVVPLPPAGWVPPQPQRATPGGDPVPGWGQGAPTGGYPQASGPGHMAPGGTSPGQGAGPGPAAPGGTSPGPAAGPAWPTQPTGVTTGARGARMAGGALLVLLGLWLLAGQYLNLDWNMLWPLLVMGTGAVLIVAALRRRGG